MLHLLAGDDRQVSKPIIRLRQLVHRNYEGIEYWRGSTHATIRWRGDVWITLCGRGTDTPRGKPKSAYEVANPYGRPCVKCQRILSGDLYHGKTRNQHDKA